MKKLVIGLIVVLAIVFVLGQTKDMIAKASVEKGMEIVTGLKLQMKSLTVGILNTLVGIKDLKLFNPQGYKDKVMIDMPEIFVDYDLPAIIKGKIHLPEVRLNLKEFVVVKNSDGKLNLDALKVVKEEKEPASKQEPAKAQKMPEIQIDRLQLVISKVVYKDYTAGAQPSVREFNINLNEKYENITDPYTLVRLILVRALMNTTIANLANFDLGSIQQTLGNTLGKAQQVATQAAAKAQQAATEAVSRTQTVVKDTAATVGTTTKGATEAIGKAAEGIKDTLTLPFGKKE